MGSLILTLIAGVAAGAFTARTVARREFELLREQLKAQNGTGAPAPATPPPAPQPAVEAKPAPAPQPEEITPEILMVLTAAVSAFLGKKAKIRRARVAQTSSSAWAQQGRVFVQASHNLPTPHHH